MYVLKKNGNYELNLIVETKDVKKESGLRNEEELRIASAARFFETLKKEGINVYFRKQLQSDDIVTMIKKMTDK